jgi:hypothetical protein
MGFGNAEPRAVGLGAAAGRSLERQTFSARASCQAHRVAATSAASFDRAPVCALIRASTAGLPASNSSTGRAPSSGVARDAGEGEIADPVRSAPPRDNVHTLQGNVANAAMGEGAAAASEKQASSLLGARHQRFLAFVQNPDCQLCYSEEARKGNVAWAVVPTYPGNPTPGDWGRKPSL